MRRMRRAPLPVAGALACLVAGGGAIAMAADDTPPKISKMGISPRKACRQKSDTCKHPGATVSFYLSEYSRVTGAVRPLDRNVGCVVRLNKKLHFGQHYEHFSVKGLTTGKWVMQLTAVDPSNNRSHTAERTFKIVK